MNLINLITITENDKRFWFALALFIILAFAIIGYIGYIISRIMDHQGKKLDALMNAIHKTRVVDDAKSFKRVSRKKSYIYFVKTSFIPFGIILVGAAILLVAEISHNFTYNIFEKEKTGFGTILFLWDFSSIFKSTDSGLLIQWPPLVNTPHFEMEAMFSYFIIPLFLVGGIWFIINICALIARTIRMYKLVETLYINTKILKPHADDLLRDYSEVQRDKKLKEEAEKKKQESSDSDIKPEENNQENK